MIALETLSLAVVTELYNSFGVNVVKKFRDKPTAVARLQKMLTEQNHEVFQADDEYDVRPVASDDEPVLLTMKGDEKLIKEADLKAIPTQPKKTRGRKSPLVGQKITILRDKNPKMPKSRAFARYEIYKTVTTSDQYIAKCTDLNLGSRREILADLAYDSKQKFIKLS